MVTVKTVNGTLNEKKRSGKENKTKNSRTKKLTTASYVGGFVTEKQKLVCVGRYMVDTGQVSLSPIRYVRKGISVH